MVINHREKSPSRFAPRLFSVGLFTAAILQLIRADCEAQVGLHYLDAGARLALPDGSPDPKLIRWDRIHLNRKGYASWASPIRERLLRDLGADPAVRTP